MKLKIYTIILALATLAGCSTTPRVTNTDYDGKWIGSIECYQRYQGNAPSYITRRVEWLIINGSGHSLPDPIWQEWAVEFNGTKTTVNGRVADPRGEWAYEFNGNITSPRHFVAQGYVYDGYNKSRIGRECKVSGVLFKPAPTSIAGRL